MCMNCDILLVNYLLNNEINLLQDECSVRNCLQISEIIKKKQQVTLLINRDVLE